MLYSCFVFVVFYWNFIKMFVDMKKAKSFLKFLNDVDLTTDEFSAVLFCMLCTTLESIDSSLKVISTAVNKLVSDSSSLKEI